MLLALAAACGPADEAGPCAPTGDAPASVADVVDRLVDLPADATVSCFVSSLPRPLGVEATWDVFSAQPAAGRASPRVFLQFDALIVTVGLGDVGADLLELGEAADGPASTVKAEIALPLADDFDEDAPFSRVLLDEGGGTTCGSCHGHEAEQRPGVYASTLFQPALDKLVPVEELAGYAEDCPDEADDARCALLHALFDHGDVVHRPFPTDLPTIYEPN